MFIFFLLLNLTWAKPVAPPAAENASPSKSQQKYLVKAGAFHYLYEEPALIKIEGTLYGIASAFQTQLGHTATPLWFSADWLLATGSTTYDGSTINILTGVVTPKTSSSRDTIFDLEGHFGASLINTADQIFDLYVGLGLWNLANSTEGKGSYSRQITYYYLPVGIQYSFKPTAALKFAAGAQYNLLLMGRVRSNFSEASSSLSDVENKQSSGSGYRAAVTGEMLLTSYAPFAEVYYQSWDIADSEKVAQGGLVFWEPHNTTKIFGLNLGARF